MRYFFSLAISAMLMIASGCYAPLRSPGIPAHTLPDSYRMPTKAFNVDLNYAMLGQQRPEVYILDAGDVIRVEIADLMPRVTRLPAVTETQPRAQGVYSNLVEAKIDEQGYVLLPLIGAIKVGGMPISQARNLIVETYAKGYLDSPKVALNVVQPATKRVMVLGNVANPGVYELGKYESDVVHAVAIAGGLIAEETDEIQVHRRNGRSPVPAEVLATHPHDQNITRIPMHTPIAMDWSAMDMSLGDGDVVVAKGLPDQTFYVVGQLSSNSLVRFNLGRDNRDLGNGFVLPKDRDIDVVTAVAMAGYIDPIDSPTTVTVQRMTPAGCPMLIKVDLIAARSDVKENIMVQGGDIIYLNPDGAWWFRRTLDRVIPNLITSPYNEAVERWINPNGVNN